MPVQMKRPASSLTTPLPLPGRNSSAEELTLPSHHICANEETGLQTSELVKDLVPFVLHFPVDGKHWEPLHCKPRSVYANL
jgi:hypothetical protein